MPKKQENFADGYKTFDEFLQAASNDILSRLMTDGGKGIRSALHLWLPYAMRIAVENEKKKEN